MNHDRRRRIAENVDAGKVVERMIGWIGDDRGNEHLRAGVAEQEGMAVGLRARHLGGAGHPASAAPVLRHYGAEHGLHLLRPQPADDVGRSARRERNDQLYDAVWIGKAAPRRHRGSQQSQAAAQHLTSIHAFSFASHMLVIVIGSVRVSFAGRGIHVVASIVARNSGVTSGMIPNQAWKAGRAWCSSMPSPFTVGFPRLRAAASSAVSRGI